MPAGNRSSVKAARGALTQHILIALAAAGVMAAGPDPRAASLYFDWPVPLLLQRPTTTLFYSIEVEDESRSDPDGERKKDYRAERIRLNFRSNGWVYHPALVTFRIGLRPELLSRKTDFSSGSQTTDKLDFLGYTIGTTWLQDKPYTLSLHSNRDRVDSSNT